MNVQRRKDLDRIKASIDKNKSIIYEFDKLLQKFFKNHSKKVSNNNLSSIMVMSDLTCQLLLKIKSIE